MKTSVMIMAILLVSGLSIHAQVSDFAGTDFSKADSVAELYVAHSLKDLKGLADKLTAPLCTEQEKFRAIFKWVCNNIEVDYALVVINKRKRTQLSGPRLDRWNERFNATVFRTLLHKNKTICTGYAYLIRELAYHAGLSCSIMNGSARPGGIGTTGSLIVNHSWNLILLNGKWYYCDATWASGIFNRTTNQFVKRFNDKYFLTEPSLFSQEHQKVTNGAL
jgi:transglutaminase/protease-like cytokinesis protein 3